MEYGDITIQNQADILPLTNVGNFSRDMSLLAGTQAITGVGFKPSYILFVSAESTVVGHASIGIGRQGASNSATLRNRYNTTADTWAQSTACIYMDVSGGAGVSYRGTIESLDSDGFTIDWVRVGAPTGTINIQFMAFK